jgi:hypothetical protein
MTLNKKWLNLLAAFTPDEIEKLTAWVLRVYFGPNNKEKRWFKEGFCNEEVLNEFLLPTSPISPEALLEIWKAMPGLQEDLNGMEDSELDSVSAYLSRNKTTTESKYIQGEMTIKEMAKILGNVTGTMVNKIAVSGTNKLYRLTSGVSPDDMEAEELKNLLLFIAKQQENAAKEFTARLLLCKCNIPAFVEDQVDISNLTEIEAKSITPGEIMGLEILSEMDYDDVVDILLTDINSGSSMFHTFQNAVSKRIYPRRAGRPKGSKKMMDMSEPDGPVEECDEDESELLEV